ncbi:hypothetical protein SLNWT_2678 [Streptomyces albus]|uniref:Uncharacterized protein n=1 Tax=Streptomyces albus (strain ATCC 21838 / DSM 41398 / FERM P-419 / JCM 4703 / NBRC 107858) TaxID=1081613 RepID=A0A0B5EN70_STRA4|nr:hypothetical protein SLNWT_2678 [Streptomyces albus]AOU77364.1 hypothetical protein SLNHY_2673 [Streptomyces albus]
MHGRAARFVPEVGAGRAACVAGAWVTQGVKLPGSGRGPARLRE